MRSTISRYPSACWTKRSPVASQWSSSGSMDGQHRRCSPRRRGTARCRGRRSAARPARRSGRAPRAAARPPCRPRRRPGGVIVMPPVASVMPKPLHRSTPCRWKKRKTFGSRKPAADRPQRRRSPTTCRKRDSSTAASDSRSMASRQCSRIWVQRIGMLMSPVGRTRAELGDQGVGRRAAGEDVGAAPVDRSRASPGSGRTCGTAAGSRAAPRRGRPTAGPPRARSASSPGCSG